jgi:hypothetical protein
MVMRLGTFLTSYTFLPMKLYICNAKELSAMRVNSKEIRVLVGLG